MVYQILISTMYLHFTIFFFGFHDSGVGGGGRCHCRRFSPVDTAVIFVPRQYLPVFYRYDTVLSFVPN